MISPSESLSSSVRAEAAAWVARLHSSSRSRDLEQGFKRWLSADPAHARAFELATEAWEIGGGARGGVLPRMADPLGERRSPRSRAYLAAAAMVLMAVGGLFYLNRQPAVTTNVGEQRMLTLEDGSRIFLNTDTRLFVQLDPNRRSVRLESGEAMFDVAKDPSRPFVVAAGDQEVMALGTSFVVRREPRQVTVTLVEGKVLVAPRLAVPIDGAAGKSVVAGTRQPPSGAAASAMPEGSTLLSPGQRLTVAVHQSPRLDEPVIEKVTAWRRGEVILDKTRLQDAAEEMNRYSAVKLLVDDAAAADIRVSGIFRAGDSARFAHAVAETYRLKVSHEERRIVISGAQP